MNKDVKNFLERLDRDPEFKNELKKALELYPEENVLYDFSFDEQIRFIYEVIIPFAKKHGYNFNVEDIITQGDANLDDEYLEKVAGGIGLNKKLSASALAAIQALTLISPASAANGSSSGAPTLEQSSLASKFEKENEQASYGSSIDVLAKIYNSLHPMSEEYPFNEVDGMVCATLSYLPMHCVPNLDSDLENKEITISEWADKLSKYYESSDNELILHSEDEHNIEKYNPKLLNKTSEHTVMQRGRVKLINILAKCPRYKNIKLGYFRGKYSPIGNDDSEQFAAVTFTLEDGTKVVTFRGTDSTLSGWKEDLDLSWSKQVPAQRDALKYLKDMYKLNPDANFFVTGHSKGGHLAVYSSFYLCSKNDDFSKNLRKILNYDGPGLRKDIVTDIAPEIFDKTSEKLTNFIPQSSVFGRIMNDTSKGKFVCVYSSAKDIFYQHDCLSWNIYEDYEKSKDDKFRSYEIQPESEFSADAISRFLDSIYNEEAMRICVNWIFDFMHRNNITMSDEKDVSKVFKEVFYNYFIKGKSLSEILDTVFSPAQTIGISKKDQESFKIVMGAAFKALVLAYWNRYEKKNDKLTLSTAPSKPTMDILTLIVNKVFSFENIGNFIKKLYS